MVKTMTRVAVFQVMIIVHVFGRPGVKKKKNMISSNLFFRCFQVSVRCQACGGRRGCWYGQVGDGAGALIMVRCTRV